MTFSVEFRDRANDPVLQLDRLQFTPQWYSAVAVGGYETAEINVDGPGDAMHEVLRLLGRVARIVNGYGQLVWVGVVDEVMITHGAMQVGLSLKNMINRVKVAYTEAANDGSLQRLTTDWAEDTESIARYGYSERVYTKSDISTAQAEAYRDTLLNTLKNPTPIIRTLRGASAPSATLSCKGEWFFLDRQLYAQVAGLEEHNITGGAEQIMGVGQTSTQIGFAGQKILDFGNKLDALPSDAKIVISGSTSNNGTITTTRAGEDGTAYTATTISFDPADDILDSADGLTFLNDFDIIDVSGSTDNDAVRVVKDAINSQHITVSGAAITTEASGDTVTITQAGWVETDTEFTGSHKVIDSDDTQGNSTDESYAELPGATVTLTAHGVYVAQKFTLSANSSWTVNDISVRIRKEGSPSDNVTCGVYQDNSGEPGTLIELVSIAGSTVAATMAWKKFTFDNSTTTLAYGTNYWIVVARSGSNSMDDFYVVDLDEDLGYAGGNLKLWTGSAWVDRTPDADMPFIIRGAEPTTTQVSTILTDAAQFVAGVDIKDASTVESNQYRNGDGTALYEIEKLIDAGDGSGNRLLAKVNADQIVSIYEQPASAWNLNLTMQTDGQLLTPSGRAVEQGVLPVAKWVQVAGIQQGVDHLAPLANFFIERCEYHVASGEWVLEPPAQDSVFDMGLDLA